LAFIKLVKGMIADVEVAGSAGEASMLENPSVNRNEGEGLPPRQRSAVTNGRRMFVEGDGNSAWSRRYRDLVAGHVSDMGGRDLLSEAQLSLIRRTSAIECELELMEGRLSKGESVDLDLFTRSASHLRRILETLGIARHSRDITPLSLREYLDAHPAAERAAEMADEAVDVAADGDAARPTTRTGPQP
jgi:hypothetical protein